jgi:hypothetical protein
MDLNNEKATRGMTPVQIAIETAKAELLKCNSVGEIENRLKALEEETKLPLTAVDAYGVLLQSMLVDRFEGVDRKGNALFEDGTWEEFCRLWIMAKNAKVAA